jgi:methylphosphotriester-DNA--protein-cysteine methyltransferase
VTYPTVPQYTEHQLTQMTPEQICQAYDAGQLATLLGGTPAAAPPATGQLHTLTGLTPEQICQAYDAGQLHTLLTTTGRTDTP